MNRLFLSLIKSTIFWLLPFLSFLIVILLWIPSKQISYAETGCNPIAIENQQVGTEAWQLTNPADDVNHQIKGYASKTSVNIGETLDFYISVSPAQSYRIQIYRLGWYNGLGGRFLTEIGPLPGTVQSTPLLEPTTGLVTTSWTSDHTLTIPAGWVSGIYAAKLINAAGFENYIIFVVRNDGRPADLLYQQSITTDQAYNNYPDDGIIGKSTYEFNSHGANTIAGTSRAVKVSFDRPMAGDGSGQFFKWEYAFVRWLERSGYDVVYSTNLDTHQNGTNLLNHAGFLSAGHDEYWSKQMRESVEAARDAGINLAFMGANAAYWQIRLEPSSIGTPDRVLTVYKNWNLDPITDNHLKTYLWRTIWQREEQKLIGVQYRSYGNYSQNTPFVVRNSNHWIYANSGFAENDSVPGLVGYEVDNVHVNYSLPISTSHTLLSDSPYVDAYGNTINANAAIYQSPSNAWIFASGTTSWSWGLDKQGIVDTRIQKTTSNLLNQFTDSPPSGCEPPPAPTPNPAQPTPIPISTPMQGLAYTAYTPGVYSSGTSDQALTDLADTGANWISLLVTWYQDDIDDTDIFYVPGTTPTDADLIHAINEAQGHGLKIMLKPHIDLRADSDHWRGEIGTNFSESDWHAWFNSYTHFISRYAELAESQNVELFAVGTELVATSHRTQAWRSVIQELRGLYNGPMTYAANHGEENQVQFWGDLDLIGIDAYYSLTTQNNPTLVELKSGWTSHRASLAGLASTYQLPIAFTEVGYRSVDGTNQKPWCSNCGTESDLQEQAEAYQAVYEIFDPEPWFVGAFWWDWSINPGANAPCDMSYSPQDKPAENVLRTWFGTANRPEINTFCPPGAVTLLSPLDDITQPAPPFIWRPVLTATSYTLVVYDEAMDSIQYLQTYLANNICSSETCVVQPQFDLSPGRYRWLVQGSNSAGVSPWSVYIQE
ncbi:MAG: N,N-dimethylformamidase beta subunit family domain-containing protein [Chloroflexota bacterium]